MVLFGTVHGWKAGGGGEGAKQGPIPNINHTYPAIMKLGTVITYLKRIQKIYK